MSRLESLVLAPGLFLPLTLGPLTLGSLPPVEDPVAAPLEELCAELEAKRADAGVPGMAICIVKEGEVVLVRCFGVANVEKKTPVTRDTVFPIGSSSKPFTSTLTAMLVTDGKLHWDDPVTDYLPEFQLKIKSGDPDAQVTIRDLYAHQTGIVDGEVLAKIFQWWRMDGTIDENPEYFTREEFLAQVVQLDAQYPFREVHSYSNSSMVAAALATANAAGTDWDSLMKKRMFEPLGMTSSFTRFDEIRKHPRLATGYLHVGDELLALPYYNMDAVCPAGGIASTIDDLAQWLRLLTQRGEFDGKRLIDEQELDEIWADHIEAHDLRPMIPGVNYALGWMVREWEGAPVAEHGGNGYGFAATVAVHPELGLACAMVSNALTNPLQVELSPLVWAAMTRDE